MFLLGAEPVGFQAVSTKFNNDKWLGMQLEKDLSCVSTDTYVIIFLPPPADDRHPPPHLV